MDVHRCRFVPYPPQAINALAFSHSSNPRRRAPPDLRLALGRENGDVEIWNPLSGNWTQETILRGSQGRSIDQVAWTQEQVVDERADGNVVQDGKLRLFSSGGGKSVVEWDLCAGAVKRQAESNFGDIWCFAAQPRLQHRTQNDKTELDSVPSQMLAAGCSDGTIVLFSTEDDDLRYLRSLGAPPAKKAKVISITWRDPDTVVAGYEDSNIRVIDVRSRTTIRTMSLGRAAKENNSVVWTVQCLPNGTILSGDSSGELKIWDAKNFSLVQRLKQHDGDVLDIAINAGGDTIVTVGVDRRTVIYKPVAGQAGNKQRWSNLLHRRYHENDVKCCAGFESKDLSVIVSGGADAVPVVSPLRGWQQVYHRSLSHLPQIPQMSCAAAARIFLTWWNQDLYLWHVTKRLDGAEVSLDLGSNEFNHELLACLRLKGEEHIQSAQLSLDGNFVVASTTTGVKLFQLRRRIDSGRLSIRTRPIELPTSLRNFGARDVGFSPNSKWLYAVRPSNVLIMVKMLQSESIKERPTFHEKTIRLSRKSRKGQDDSTLGGYPQTITHVTFSTDSRVLATGDLSGNVDTWVLEGHEDLSEVGVDEKDTDSNSDT